jgi:hypothetical protein
MGIGFGNNPIEGQSQDEQDGGKKHCTQDRIHGQQLLSHPRPHSMPEMQEFSRQFMNS